MLGHGVEETGVGRTFVTAWGLHRTQARGTAASQAQTGSSGFSEESLIFLCKGLQGVNGSSNSFFFLMHGGSKKKRKSTEKGKR